MKLKAAVIFFTAAVMMQGCVYSFKIDLSGWPRIGERKNPEHSLVFGYFGPGGRATTINWVSIQQFEPFTEKPYLNTGLVYGHFFNSDVPKGSFCMDSVSVSHSFSTTKYRLHSDFGCFEVEKTGLYFFGSYEVYVTNQGAQLNNLKQPDEEAVIRKILNYTDKGTYWEKEMNKRLVKLQEIKARKSRIPRAI